MDLEALLQQIGRRCTSLEAGGFRPTHELDESWLGRVSYYSRNESIPTDTHGDRMVELGQFYLPAFPYVPPCLSEVVMLTAFISPELQGDSDLMEGCFAIREYREVDSLVQKSFGRSASGLKPFPLRPHLVETDHPVWDGGGLTPEQEDAFLALEEKNVISNYYDVTSHAYGHKFGGYPSFCQSGVDLHPHEFVFQVSSDPKIELNVIDNGSLTFWRHPN
ncbi:MAG: DUF1963 domain-containing protein, partial [Myxococcota bacterium]